jgi:hypothetical protein
MLTIKTHQGHLALVGFLLRRPHGRVRLKDGTLFAHIVNVRRIRQQSD